MKDLCLVAGTRPNFMKIAPLVRELARRPGEWRYSLVHTGQHFDREMHDVFFEDLEIPAPDVKLAFGGATHAEQSARVMTEFETVLRSRRPDMGIVEGEVDATLACGIAAEKEAL